MIEFRLRKSHLRPPKQQYRPLPPQSPHWSSRLHDPGPGPQARSEEQEKPTTVRSRGKARWHLREKVARRVPPNHCVTSTTLPISHTQDPTAVTVLPAAGIAADVPHGE
ncbi:hypothetical protein NDU88_006409 [Pleurodeles waltl]|uniref:Uncharacterized protein n=1 Tax=Pleurodeles waltl TaxID=8319 RepID=A0AAV7PKX3_PLEWA|nr:hypothetical protein NDU88_006409 [Pleurodeles waltl]